MLGRAGLDMAGVLSYRDVCFSPILGVCGFLERLCLVRQTRRCRGALLRTHWRGRSRLLLRRCAFVLPVAHLVSEVQESPVKL
jgi:hypothetical protein